MTGLLRSSSRRARALVLGTAVVFLLVLLACAHVEPRVDPSLASGALIVDGRERTFLSWEAGAGAPLVLALHGRLGTPAGMAKLSGLLPLAQRERFTVVFPAGIERSWRDAREVGPAAEQGVDDVRFLTGLIDEFVRRGADPSRVFVMGMSNGGFMALTLACRAGDRLAGLVSVTGALSRPLAEACPWPRRVPVVFFLGTEDPLVPFEGGAMKQGRGEVLSAEDGARFFAAKNGCATSPELSALPDLADDGTRVELQRFAGCAAPVGLYVVRGGGHAWPGGWKYLREAFVGRRSEDVNASEAAWRFLTAR
ncbi:MAG: alpha/beta hydrolase family esterase [Myxococcota bacterium]